MGYESDCTWSGLGLVFMGMGWAGLRTLGPTPITGVYAGMFIVSEETYTAKVNETAPNGFSVVKATATDDDASSDFGTDSIR